MSQPTPGSSSAYSDPNDTNSGITAVGDSNSATVNFQLRAERAGQRG